MAFLDAAAAWLDDTLQASDGRAVTFRRGADSVSITATVGATPFIDEAQDGYTIQWESRDFILSSADLILSGDVVQPQVGDVFEQTIGSDVCTFLVVAPINGQCFRYADAARQTIRIHTKQASKVSS